MKAKISKSLLLPTLYGLLAAWIVMSGVGVALMRGFTALSVWSMWAITTAVMLFSVLPAMMRAAWVYSNLRRHHTAEYFYNLGNGADISKAVPMFERKVNRAISAMLKRHLLQQAFNGGAVAYLFTVINTGDWLKSLWVVIGLAVMVISVEVGVWTMLLFARKLSYDKYGNLKNS